MFNRQRNDWMMMPGAVAVQVKAKGVLCIIPEAERAGGACNEKLTSGVSHLPCCYAKQIGIVSLKQPFSLGQD